MGRTSLRSADNLPHRQWTDLTVERYRDYEGRHGLFQEDQTDPLSSRAAWASESAHHTPFAPERRMEAKSMEDATDLCRVFLVPVLLGRVGKHPGMYIGQNSELAATSHSRSSGRVLSLCRLRSRRGGC